MNTITTNTKLETAAIENIITGYIGNLPTAIKPETVIDLFRGVTIGAAESALTADTDRGNEIADAVRPILCALPTIEAVYEAVETMHRLFDRFQRGEHIMPNLDTIHPELGEKFIAELTAAVNK